MLYEVEKGQNLSKFLFIELGMCYQLFDQNQGEEILKTFLPLCAYQILRHLHQQPVI